MSKTKRGMVVYVPVLYAIPYFLIEAVVFWGISQWLGVGWALLLLFVCFFGGLFLAALEMRRIAMRASQGKTTAGKLAGDYALVAAGAFLVALPGFFTTIIGLLLIVAPTRAVARRVLARKFRAKIESLGARSFATVNQFRQQTSYGSFVVEHEPDEATEVARIQHWSNSVQPEDFNSDKD